METARTTTIDVEIVFKAKILCCYERFKPKWVSGYGESTVFEQVSLGWYIHLDGSNELLFVGNTDPKPIPNATAEIRITLPCRR